MHQQESSTDKLRLCLTLRSSNFAGLQRWYRLIGQINLANVIRDTEEDLAMVECFDENGKCVINPVCRLQHIIGQALNAFYQYA